LFIALQSIIIFYFVCLICVRVYIYSYDVAFNICQSLPVFERWLSIRSVKTIFCLLYFTKNCSQRA